MNKKFLLFALLALFTILFCDTAAAQSITLNMEDAPGGSATARIFSVLMLITILSLAPSILVMMTSFIRISVVLSITRSALATNTTPPNMVLVSLALFLTFFVMAPTFEKAWDEGISPIIEDKVDIMDGLEKAVVPLKEFMVSNTREKDLLLFTDLAKEKPAASVEETPLKIAVPAFMISELRRAFEI